MTCLSRTKIKSAVGIMYVDCGKCAECLKKKRNDMFIRLREELKVSSSAQFITLSYNDDNLVWGEDSPTLCYRDVELFFKKLRKALEPTGKKVKYYLVGEYGTKYRRPHYHLILFNVHRKLAKHVVTYAWDKGFVHVGQLNDRSINYVCKYHTIANKKNVPRGTLKPFHLYSKGLGISYVERMRNYHLNGKENTLYYDFYGVKFRLPRYYKDKLFTKEQRFEIFKAFIEKYNIEYETVIETRRELSRKNLEKKYKELKFEFKKKDNSVF